MISQKALKEVVKGLQVPTGFTATMEKDDNQVWKQYSQLVYVLKSKDNIEIRIEQNGSGHVNFDGLTFDRLGVEDSFYFLPMWEGDKDVYDLNSIIPEQLARIEKARASHKTAITVPGLPFSVQPKELERLKKQLRETGRIQFMPSGFGTGYVVSRNRQLHHSIRAGRQLEQFFGVGALYIEKFDCD